jgi:hypothetical protein
MLFDYRMSGKARYATLVGQGTAEKQILKVDAYQGRKLWKTELSTPLAGTVEPPQVQLASCPSNAE